MFIVILGGGIHLQGNLPPHVYQRLDKALLLSKSHPQARIVLSGKHSFLYRQQKPPITEARKMAEYLLEKGVLKKQILLEQKSKDTIGNAYYLKKLVFLPRQERSAIVITSPFHLSRVRYIFGKVFGSDYKLQFVGSTESFPLKQKAEIVKYQKELLLKTKLLLSKMKDGDHNFLKGKLYKIKYYKEPRPGWVMKFVAKGK